MRPLSYFDDSDFAMAMMDEYGECLQVIKADCNWLQWIFGKTYSSLLLPALIQNISLTSYSESQRALMLLAIESHREHGSFDRFREILEEYA